MLASMQRCRRVEQIVNTGPQQLRVFLDLCVVKCNSFLFYFVFSKLKLMRVQFPLYFTGVMQMQTRFKITKTNNNNKNNNRTAPPSLSPSPPQTMRLPSSFLYNTWESSVSVHHAPLTYIEIVSPSLPYTTFIF